MPMQTLETDYLIVGAGAMGMAFADVMFTESPKAQLIIVDRQAKPGGHWNNAYPFVALHQPAAFYGVNSEKLGRGGEDLASGAEILAYYERVMHRFLESGRVRFLPMSDYQQDGRIVSTVNSEASIEVTVACKVVDATFMNVQVPSVTKPKYSVGADVALVPPNHLPKISKPWARYNVIGAGKTGMDAILFLLDKGVDPDKIQWITPNDAWLWERAPLQPGLAMHAFLQQLDAIKNSVSVDALFLALEQSGSVCRIDTENLPVKWRCATIDRAELENLRKIKNVVRQGRVQSISTTEISLDEGTIPTDAQTLHIDCTADGLARREPQPIFEPGKITLQSVFMCQQVLSAAILAHLEQLKLSDDERNTLCKPVPHPEYKQDYATGLIASFQNLLNITPHMPVWLRKSRLYLMHHEPLHRYIWGSLKVQRSMSATKASVEKMIA